MNTESLVTCTASPWQLNLAKTQQTDHSHAFLRAQIASTEVREHGNLLIVWIKEKSKQILAECNFPSTWSRLIFVWNLSEIRKLSKFSRIKKKPTKNNQPTKQTNKKTVYAQQKMMQRSEDSRQISLEKFSFLFSLGNI